MKATINFESVRCFIHLSSFVKNVFTWHFRFCTCHCTRRFTLVSGSCSSLSLRFYKSVGDSVVSSRSFWFTLEFEVKRITWINVFCPSGYSACSSLKAFFESVLDLMRAFAGNENRTCKGRAICMRGSRDEQTTLVATVMIS